MALIVLNRVRVTVPTLGAGTVTFGAVFSDLFMTPAEAGAVDGDQPFYLFTEGLDFELGIGTIGNSIAEMSRDRVLKSKIAGVVGTAKMSLTGTAQLRFVDPAEVHAFLRQIVITAGTSYSMDDSDEHILINKTVGSATTVSLVTAVGRLKPIHIVDLKLDADVNPITIFPSGTETIRGLSTWVLASPGASITLYPFPDGTGWYTLADVTDAANVAAAGAVMETDFDANTILAATLDNTPVPITISEETIVGRVTGGNITDLSAAQVRSIINVENAADVTDAANVNAAGAVMEADFNANTILAATTDNTPIPITIDQNDLVGRLPSGAIGGITVGDLTEEPTPAAGDFLAGWVGGVLRKFDVGDLPSGGGSGIITPYDFGAVGDGVTNDISALINASAAAVAADAELVIPQGTFLISSSATLGARIKFDGGVISAASTTNLTLTGTLEAPPIPCFAFGASAGVLGTPKLVADCVYPEMWGAIPDGTTDCKLAIQQALNFAMQYDNATDTLIRGCIVQLLTGSYLVTGALLLTAGRGVTFQGKGAYSSHLVGNMASGMFTMLTVEGIGSSTSDFGIRLLNMRLDTGTDSPTTTGGTSLVSVKNARVLTIEGCSFARMFRGLSFIGCSASGAIWINDCRFDAPVMATANSGSCFIGTFSDPVTGRNSGIYVRGCVGNGTGSGGLPSIEACVRLAGGADQFWMSDSHWFAAARSTVWIISDAEHNTGNLKITNCAIEQTANVAGTKAFEISGANNQVRRVLVSNTVFFSGSGSQIHINSSVAREIAFNGCAFHSGEAELIRLTAGEYITFSGCTGSRANMANTAGQEVVLIEGATNVVFDNFSYTANAEDNVTEYGIRCTSGNGQASNLRIDVTAVNQPVVTAVSAFTWTGLNGANTLPIGAITKKQNLPDDTATSIQLAIGVGVYLVSIVSTVGGSGAPNGAIRVRTGTSPAVSDVSLQTLTNITLTTGALTGTTGTDGNYTISAHTDGKLYLENRTGGAKQVYITCLGSD